MFGKQTGPGRDKDGYVGRQDWVQPIPVQSQSVERAGEPLPTKRSWGEAYALYKANPREAAFVKLATKVLTLWLPFDIADEAIPVFGQLDDPLVPAAFGLMIYTLWRVRRYRRV